MSRRMAAFRWVLLLLALYLMGSSTTAAPVDSSQEIHKNDLTSDEENMSEKHDQSLINENGHENEDSKEDTPTKNEELMNVSDNKDEELLNDSTGDVEDDKESHETVDTKEHTNISSETVSHEDHDEKANVISKEKESHEDVIEPNNNSKETENVKSENAAIDSENMDKKSHEKGTSKELDTSADTDDAPVTGSSIAAKSSTESAEDLVENSKGVDNSNEHTKEPDSEVISVNGNNMGNTEHLGNLLSSSKEENDENQDNTSSEDHEETEEEPSLSSENADIEVGKSHENSDEKASQQETLEESDFINEDSKGSDHDDTQNEKDITDVQKETHNHDVKIVDEHDDPVDKEDEENSGISHSAHLEMSKDQNGEQESANESEDHEDAQENKTDKLINEESGEQGKKDAAHDDYDEDEDEENSNTDLSMSSAKHVENIHPSGKELVTDPKESLSDTEESTEISKKSEELHDVTVEEDVEKSAASHENVEDTGKSTEEESEEVAPSPLNSSASNENNLETSHEDHDENTSLLNESDENTTESSTEDHDVPVVIHSASEEKDNENDGDDLSLPAAVHATSEENDSDSHGLEGAVHVTSEENDSDNHGLEGAVHVTSEENTKENDNENHSSLIHATSEENTKENDSNDNIPPDVVSEEDTKENDSDNHNLLAATHATSEEETKEDDRDSNTSQANRETSLNEDDQILHIHKEESDVGNKETSLEASESKEEGSADGSDETSNLETASQDIKHDNSKIDDKEHHSNVPIKNNWSESDESGDFFNNSKEFNFTDLLGNHWDESSASGSDDKQKEGSGNEEDITPTPEEHHIVRQRVQSLGAVPGGDNSEETTDCPFGDDCSNSSAVTGDPGLVEENNVTGEIIPEEPNLGNNNDTTVPILSKGSGRKQLEDGGINEPGVDSRSEEPETAEGSMGSYVVLGVIMATIVVLLGYSILKSRRRNASESKNEDFGTEMIDVKKTLLPGSEHNGTIHPKGHSGDDSNSKLLPHPDYKGDNEESDEIEKVEQINGLNDKSDLNRQQSIDFDSIESQLEPTTNPFKSQSQEGDDAFPEVVIQKEREPIIAQSARDRFFSTNPFKQNASENTNGYNNMPEVVIEKTPTYSPVYNGYANGNTNGLASGSQDQMSIPSSPTTKVKVVATVDEDSILKKPIIINRDQNGVTY